MQSVCNQSFTTPTDKRGGTGVGTEHLTALHVSRFGTLTSKVGAQISLFGSPIGKD